jgi:hypothetical protein
MSSSRCNPFWFESPSVLVEHWADFFPFTEKARKCTANALNALIRFGLYLGLLLAVLHQHGSYLGITFGIAVLSVAAYYGMKQRNILREGFEDMGIVGPTLFTTPGSPSPNFIGGIDVAGKTVADVIGTKDRTYSLPNNPYMGVLVNEVLDNPTKPPAISVDNSDMARQLSDNTQDRLYGDPGDVFQHMQNQRTWVVPPSTSIPNDQESFQNWLFRVPGLTCKEGNLAVCQTGTEGGQIPWLAAP